MSIYKRLFAYVPKDKLGGYLSILFSIASAVFSVLGYYYIYKILLALLILEDYEKSKSFALITIGLLTLGGVFYFIAGIFSHILGFRLETNLRKKGIDGLMSASFRFFDMNSSGVIRKTIDDNAAQTHQAVAHMIPDLGQAFVMPILTLILAFFVSLKLGLILIVMIIVGALLMGSMMGGEKTFLKTYQDALKRLSGETVEYVRGIQVVKIFKADVHSFKALYEAIVDYAQNAYAYSRSCKLPYVLYQWLFYGIIPLLLIPLAFYLERLDAQAMWVIEFMMLLFLSGVISVCFMRLMFSGQFIFQATYALDNLEGIYEDMQKDRLSFGTETQINDYSIAFDKVSFSYSENLVLKDLSFNLSEGKSYALVGASGSGKSTIAKLLSGFYQVDSGNILLGGKPLTAYTEETVTQAIAFVFQNPKLFKCSIYDNVALAKKNATKEEVMNVLHLAGCDDIIAKFPERENTLIGAKGVYLSGGEKQRLAIARAMLKEAKIIIMDEASAAIDADNEYRLQQAFKALMKDKTVIMIAHRLSSIENVDEIIVLDKGKIIERGSHASLMEAGGSYRHQVDLYYKANDWRLNLHESTL